MRMKTLWGIWQNLYQFPLVESPSEVDLVALKTISEYKALSDKLIKLKCLNIAGYQYYKTPEEQRHDIFTNTVNKG